jgi:hypothetical protein
MDVADHLTERRNELSRNSMVEADGHGCPLRGDPESDPRVVVL